MEVKCGVDIIEVARVQECIESMGDSFLNKIYTENEIEYCNSKKNMMYQHFAARFAAKEAIFKAISTLLKDKYEISWQNAEIICREDGKPEVHFIGVSFPQIQSIDISLSHLKEYAIANCTVIIGDVS